MGNHDIDIHELNSASPDFHTELARQLQRIVPEAIADGKVDVAKLSELLQEDVGDTNERFGLFWPGKKRAMRAAQEPTTATLKPAKDLSKDWDSTQNIFIEGDNLEVLKLLQKQYHSSIKMIYIDPPYNTGKDFVYPDNFQEGLQNYLEFSKQVDEGSKKISTNTETAGRYHSNWLNMMYPRLKLARNLLTDDGVIFISIDDNELSNLIRVSDEIFGENNRVGVMKRRAARKSANLSKSMSDVCDYVIIYSKSDEVASLSVETVSDSTRPVFNAGNKLSTRTISKNTPARCEDGVYEPGEYKSKSMTYSLNNRMVIKDGKLLDDITVDGPWRVNQELLSQTVFITKNGGFRRELLQEEYEKVKVMNDLLDQPQFYNENGTEETTDLFDSEKLFDTPKPVDLIKHLILAASDFGDNENMTVLDFFSGSATTAHAVMQLNAEDGGNRKHIQVQLPEPTDENSEAYKAGYRKISDIARERINRAGEKIKADFADKLAQRDTPFDIGYRAYKLSDTNFTKWQSSYTADVSALQQRLDLMRESSNDYASEQDLLTEIMLKIGLPLITKVEPAEINGLVYYRINDSLLVYLNEKVKPSLDQLHSAADKLPSKIVILEDAFQGDDQLKTNLHQICKINKIELWTV